MLATLTSSNAQLCLSNSGSPLPQLYLCCSLKTNNLARKKDEEIVGLSLFAFLLLGSLPCASWCAVSENHCFLYSGWHCFGSCRMFKSLNHIHWILYTFKAVSVAGSNTQVTLMLDSGSNYVIRTSLSSALSSFSAALWPYLWPHFKVLQFKSGRQWPSCAFPSSDLSRNLIASHWLGLTTPLSLINYCYCRV